MNNKRIIEKLKQYFKETKFIGFDSKSEFNVTEEISSVLRDGTTRDIYVISFLSIVIHNEQKILFAIMDKKTEEFLYIMGPSGYIEV